MDFSVSLSKSAIFGIFIMLVIALTCVGMGCYLLVKEARIKKKEDRDVVWMMFGGGLMVAGAVILLLTIFSLYLSGV